MRTSMVVLAVLCAGCMEERTGPGEATPIVPMARPPGPPGRPPELKPPPVVEVPDNTEPQFKKEPEPTEPAGLTRTRVGDTLEFSWSRVNESQLDPGAAMAMVMQGGAGTPGMPSLDAAKDPTKLNPKDLRMPDQIERVRGMAQPKPTVQTGTLTIVRIEPESPFTFRLEVKSGKDVEQKVFAYGPDVALHKVRFHVDPDDPKKKAKAAGVVWDCVQREGRLVDPNAAPLALAGGLVSDTSVETERIGAVSVALTRIATTKATAATGEKARALDTFETPIAIAMQQVQKFGVVDPEEKAIRDATVQTQVGAAAQTCLSKLKPADGTLEGVIAGRKVESLMWKGKPAPKPFDTCVRAELKKVKLPVEETFINVPLGDPAE